MTYTRTTSVRFTLRLTYSVLEGRLWRRRGAVRLGSYRSLVRLQPCTLGISHWMVLLPSAYLTPSPSSVRTSPSQDPALEEHKREDYEWVRMLVPRQPGSDIRNWAVGPGKKGMFVSSINRGVQDRWRSAAWCTLIECRASAPFPGRLGGDGAESSNKGLRDPWEAVSGRYEIPWVSAKDAIDSINR